MYVEGVHLYTYLYSMLAETNVEKIEWQELCHLLSTHNQRLMQAFDPARDLDNLPPDVPLKLDHRSLQPKSQRLWSHSCLLQLSKTCKPACGAGVLKQHRSIGKVDYPQLVTNNKIILL